MNTRFMSRMFSAVAEGDEELTQQVANDIEGAKKNGSVSTDELTYVDLGCGKVEITDNENGEQTIAEKAEDGNYDLYPAGVENQSEQIEGYLHPESDGVTPGDQEGEPDEDVYEDHNPNTELPENWDEMYAEDDDKVCPECGKEPCECDEDDDDDDEKEEEEKEFSVYSDNTVVQRIFSDQVFCERIFSEVIETEDSAKVGNLKIEKLDDEENAVIVTDENSGDQAKVVLDDDDMEVTELDSKNFSDDGEEDYNDSDNDYMPLHIVGVDTFNHQIVDAPEYTEEDAQDLVERLQEIGIDGIKVFEDQDAARDYAMSLLESLDVEDVDEPEQVEFSEHDVYVTPYYTNNTNFMTRLFSEACNEIDATQKEIEGALEDGEETETDNEIITPVDDDTVIVEDKDNGELTKVIVDGDSLDCSPISEEEAEELKNDYEKDDDEDDEEEKTYSNYEETKFFSASEYMTDYMVRLFSEEADEADIEKAIEKQKQVETEDEIITPVDDETAVIEDKENGEYTKAVMSDDDIEVIPISEEEAAKLTEEKTYSNNKKTKFFSENEYMTDYMCRVFSDEAEADEDDIKDAIESGKKVETDEETITPIDDKTAIIEDKENGEYTKATIDDDDDSIDLSHIDEEEAEDMINDADIDDTDEEDKDDVEDEEEEKSYSYMDKFFAQVEASKEQGEPEVVQAVYDEKGNLVPLEEANKGNEEGAPSVEAIEDAALAAVQAINNAANEGANAIMSAKNAPAEEGEQAELQEAQFSYNDDDDFDYEERTFTEQEDTLVSWLHNNQK